MAGEIYVTGTLVPDGEFSIARVADIEGAQSATDVSNAIGTALASYSTTTEVGEAIAGAISAIPQASAETDGLMTVAHVAALAAAQSATDVSTAIGTALTSYSTTTEVGEAISGAIGDIPDATTETDGLMTTAQVGTLGKVVDYEANWAVTDWYVDSVNGSDANAGTSSGAALASLEELSARLAVPMPCNHSVTVHVAQGSYGTLAVTMVQPSPGVSFDVVGAVSLASIGTVTSYTDRVVASNYGSHLVVSGVSDWASYEGRRVDVADGASLGALCWVAKANPHSLGASTARTTRFAKQPTTPGGQPSYVDPADGSAVSLATLPTIARLSISVKGTGISSSSTFATGRVAGVFDLDIGTIDILVAGYVAIDGCSIKELLNFARNGNVQDQLLRSKFIGRYTFETIQTMQCMGCLFPTDITQSVSFNSGAQVYDSIFQGTQPLSNMFALFSGVGVFDFIKSNDAISMSSAGVRDATYTSCFGQGNNRSGLTVQRQCRITSSSCAITGATGDIRLPDGTMIPWTSLPWVDGERSGEATLVGGTVDVTVPYVLSTQKVIAVAKTFGGTPGFLSAIPVYAISPDGPTLDPNHVKIRITSSSATDTSVVTWHILPVGDNCVIRS